MIELFIILVLAAVGWLVWTGKLDLKSLTGLAKRVSGSTAAATGTASRHQQPQPPAPAAPVPQAAEPTVATEIQTPTPIVEPIAPSTPAAPIPAVTEAPVVPAIEKAPAASTLPEDSILKRHYLAALEAEKDALSNPYPTDSVLRRHYDALHKIDVPKAAEVAAASTQAAVIIETSGNETQMDKPSIPTDSVLKRHHEQLIRSAM